MSAQKTVLILCEYSGIVRNAFTSAGYTAISCDLIPSSSPGLHFIGDALEAARIIKPDLIIGHPPCRYLSKAGLHLCINNPERKEEQRKAVEFVRSIYNLPCKHIAIENPDGFLSSGFRPYDQLVRPYHFGAPYNKAICLWLKNLPPLIHTCVSSGRKSVNNHTNARMTREERSRVRSRFFPQVAEAMANQWSI